MNYVNVSQGVLGPIVLSGAPAAGVNCVQQLTIGGAPTGGTFRLALDGLSTGPIIWNNNNATLLNYIQQALDARFGTAAIVATAGALTAGVGTILLTFSGAGYAKRAVSTMTATNSMVGTSPTIAVATTTPGVNAVPAYAPPGSMWINPATGLLYVANTAGTLVPQV